MRPIYKSEMNARMKSRKLSLEIKSNHLRLSVDGSLAGYGIRLRGSIWCNLGLVAAKIFMKANGLRGVRIYHYMILLSANSAKIILNLRLTPSSFDDSGSLYQIFFSILLMTESRSRNANSFGYLRTRNLINVQLKATHTMKNSKHTWPLKITIEIKPYIGQC